METNNPTEMKVLSALLINPSNAAAIVIATGLAEGHFSEPRNRRIFRTVLSMVSGGREVSYIKLALEFRDRDILDLIGGAEYLAELYTYLPSADDAPIYISALLAAHTKREEVRKCLREAREKLALKKANH